MGQRPGIVGVGQILGPTWDLPDSNFEYRLAGHEHEFEGRRPRVPVWIESVLDTRLTEDELRLEPTLAGLSILNRVRRGTRSSPSPPPRQSVYSNSAKNEEPPCKRPTRRPGRAFPTLSLAVRLISVGVEQFHVPDLEVSGLQRLQRLRLPCNHETLALRSRRFPSRLLRTKLLSLHLDAQREVEHALDQDAQRRDGSASPEELTGDLREEIDRRLHRK